MGASGRPVIALGILFILGGCGKESAEGGTPGFQWSESTLSSGFSVSREIRLEESDSVLNVRPFSFSLGPRKEIVLADFAEAQVRVYDSTGALLKQVGRRGDGPNELQAPLNAILTDHGDLIVVDVSRGISRWSAVTGTVEEGWDIESPRMLFNVKLLDDSLALVGGYQPGRAGAHLLHLYDRASDTIIGSCFPLPLEKAQLPFASTVGYVVSHVENNEVTAAFSFSDTAFVFHLPTLRMVKKIPLPIPDFSYNPEREKERAGPNALMSRVRLVRSLARLPDGNLLVQYAVPTMPEESFGMIIVDENGELLATWERSPQILMEDWPDLYVMDPEAWAPNRILVGKFIL